MTLKEVREAVIKSTYPDWFKRQNVVFNYRGAIQPIEKEGFNSIYQYVNSQAKGWERHDNLPTPLEKSKKWFSQIKSQLLNIIQNSNSESFQHLQTLWNNSITKSLHRVSLEYIVPHDAPETIFLLELFDRKPEFFQGAFDFLIKNDITQNPNSSDYFSGVLSAYEYQSQEYSEIVKRKKSEKRSISHLRADFEKQLEKSESQIIEYLKESKEKFEETAHSFDNYLNGKKQEFEDWHKEVISSNSELYETSQKRLTELEELYQEKLKLEAPAKYWNDRAKKLRKEGNWWLRAMIVTALLAVLSLGIILYFISDGTLKELFSATGSAVRWSIVFITFISFLAYAIRTFSKLTFSSFHLVRDAEEREQLVYVYLSLVKEKELDETERHLVMQSIFSRADSGLLKDDSSPTMPGNIVDKFINK